jgi:hypothetical protein
MTDTGRYDPIPELAALIRAVAYGKRLATDRVDALLSRLGIDGNDPVSVDAIEAGLRRSLGLADPDAEPSLGERVTDSLLGAGFRVLTPAVPITDPSFSVLPEGGRLEIALHWAALNDLRGMMLGVFASALRSAGFEVHEQDGHLYVPDPKRAGQDAATAAVEDKP